MTPEELQVLKALTAIVGEYRQKVMTGRLTGDLIDHDCEPYLNNLKIIRTYQQHDSFTCSVKNCPLCHQESAVEGVSSRIPKTIQEKLEDQRSIAEEVYWKEKQRDEYGSY